MADIDAELDDFLASSDSSFELASDQESEKENIAPLQQTVSEEDASDDETALKRQIEALQEKLKKTKSKSPSKSKPIDHEKLSTSDKPSKKSKKRKRSISIEKIRPEKQIKSSMTAPITQSLTEKSSQAASLKKASSKIHNCPYSNLRYSNAEVTPPELQTTVAGINYVPLHLLKPKSPENFFTIAVCVNVTTKTSSNGNDFCLVKISNLFSCPNTGWVYHTFIIFNIFVP